MRGQVNKDTWQPQSIRRYGTDKQIFKSMIYIYIHICTYYLCLCTLILITIYIVNFYLAKKIYITKLKATLFFHRDILNIVSHRKMVFSLLFYSPFI